MAWRRHSSHGDELIATGIWEDVYLPLLVVTFYNAAVWTTQKRYTTDNKIKTQIKLTTYR
jgi:hypothetical protein